VPTDPLSTLAAEASAAGTETEILGDLQRQYRQRVDNALRHLDEAERAQLLALVLKALDGE